MAKTIASKQQELAALAKIMEIVDGLGEGSYLAMAFEGCFEVASDNISNDFGNSYFKAAQMEAEKVHKLELKLQEAETLLAGKTERVEKLKTQREELETKLKAVEGRHDQATACYTEALQRICEVEAALKKKDEEIVRLKAELYDYIVQGKTKKEEK